MKRALLLTSAAVAAAISMVGGANAAAPKGLDIYFVDVEGGAATLMVTPAGESVLVDAGWPRADARDAKRIEGVARYTAGLKQIDHFVCTHWHTDHYGDVEQLSKLIPIRRFWDRGIPETASDGAKDFPELIAAYKRASGGKSTALKAGDSIPLKRDGEPISLKVVASNGKVVGEREKTLAGKCAKHGDAPAPDDSDNMRSVSLLLKFGDFTFLNCGDLTWDIEHKLACPDNRVGKVDVWQVTHHGWEASGNPALIEATKPKVAVMVNGARKGASASVVRTIKKSPSIEGFYQLHKALGNSAEDNTTPDKIANMDEKCSAEFFRVGVSPGSERYTVYKGGATALQSYSAR